MSNKLRHLSNEELTEYYKLYATMNQYSTRAERVKAQGIDCKFAYHVVRLMLEAEQILGEGDLDLERNSEVLKAIRRGEWTLEKIEEFFQDKEKALEKLYEESTLPWGPQEEKIKGLLISCLEEHFGSLDKALVIPGKYERAYEEIKGVVDRYR